MAVVDKLSGAVKLDKTLVDGPIQDTFKEIILTDVKRAIWTWYRNNQDKVLISKRIVFFTFRVKISDIRFLIEEIAGQELY